MAPTRASRIAHSTAKVVTVGLLTMWATVGVTGSASATTTVSTAQEIAASWRSDPVYVGTGTNVDAAGAREIRDAVARAVSPMYVAVVPEGGPALNDLVEQAGATGLRPGTIAVIRGRELFAYSVRVQVSDLVPLAAVRGSTISQVAVRFVNSVDARDRGAGDSGSDGAGSGSGSGGSGIWLLGLVAVGGAGVGTLAYRANKRRQATQAAELASVRTVIDEDVTQFGEQLSRVDMGDPDLDDAGRADLQAALDSYDRAKSAAERMRRAEDARAVTNDLEDGRFALACVTARLEQRPLPERRAPCFVDPRHGPSVRDVMWAPDGGAERDVPVCAACATTFETGGVPAAREVPVLAGAGAGGRMPYWQAGRQYGPYAGGYYQSFAGVLPAVLMGTMLASAITPPAFGSPMDPGAAGGAGGLGTGGDSGGWAGGNFGGGGADFGGGWGGGDFGGGDGGGGGSSF